MLAVLLALHLWGHHADRVHSIPTRSWARHGRVHAWHWHARYDGFTRQWSCTLKTSRIHVRSQTVIFGVRHGVDTTHSYFTIDSAAPRPVSDVFVEDQKHGIFPERGWIDDRAGGEVALPLDMVIGARQVAIRPTPNTDITFYDVHHLAPALAELKATGCPDSAL
jgi:hypothetical protein